jgi:hypothetical protein
MTADFNGDGNLDFAVGLSTQTALLFGNGDGTFQAANLSLDNYSAIYSADFNMDGKADLIGVGSTGYVQVQLGNGNGTFTPLNPWGIVQNRVYPVAADFNGDGIPDMMGYQGFGGEGDYYQGAFLGNGDGTFGSFIYFPGIGSFYDDGSATVLQVADMNGDGKPDLIVSAAYVFGPNPGIFVLLNTTESIPGTSFSPASVSFKSQAAGTSSGPIPVMLTNTGAVALTVTGIAVTGTDASQFSQTNNCSRVPPTYSCTIQVTFSPTVAGNARANLAVADNASGSPQLVSLSGVAVNGSGSELGLTIPSGGSSSQTVQAGRVATYTLSIGGMGWSGQVTLSCTGAPTGSTCSFPGGANMNVSGGNATQFKVTASTTAPSMAAVTPRSQLNSAWLWAMGLVGFVILPGSLKMKRARLGAGMMTVFLVLLCSCGGGGSGGGSGASGGTPAGTYTLTVKATAGSVNESLPLKLIVQ